jgi:hypothetical protein
MTEEIPQMADNLQDPVFDDGPGILTELMRNADAVCADPLAEARREGAAAERARILVSDETLHADGSIGPDTAPPWGGDAAYWYRRWLFAVKQLDEEGSQRISAYVGMREHLDEVAAAAGANVAADRIRLEERARIRQLALDCDATYCEPCHDKRSHTNGYSERESFADLLDGAS